MNQSVKNKCVVHLICNSTFIFLPQYRVREDTLEKYKADYEDAMDLIKKSKLILQW